MALWHAVHAGRALMAEEAEATAMGDGPGSAAKGGLAGLVLLAPREGTPGERLADLGAAFAPLARDPGCRGILLVLRGRGGALDPSDAQAAGQLARRIEACPHPVIAHLAGAVSGVEAALALAAHYRLAEPGASLSFPEARFGLLPGAGVTQRLPRLIGAAEALRMLLATRPEGAATLLAMGALDQVGEGGPEAALADFLAARGGALPPPRPTARRDEALRDGRTWLAACRAAATASGAAAGGAGAAIPRAVEAALLLPFAQGLSFEEVSLEDLVALPQTRALALAAKAEAAARARLRAVEAGQAGAAPAAPLTRLGLWHAGATRAELVIAALARGLAVNLAGPDREALRALVDRVATLQQAMVAQGRLAPEARDADWTRLALREDAARLAAASDLVLVAGPEGIAPDEAGAVPILLLGLPSQEASRWKGVPALLPAMAPGGHAELSQEADAPPAATAAALALARRMGWAIQVVGPGGFIAPALRRVLHALPAQLGALGHDRRAISEGLAAAGVGAVTLGPREAPGGALLEIGRMGIAALANEGANLIAQGIAASAAEVDAAALAAGIMPRWAGGPMYQADLRGPLLLRADLQRLKGEGRLAMSEALDAALRSGRRFYD